MAKKFKSVKRYVNSELNVIKRKMINKRNTDGSYKVTLVVIQVGDDPTSNSYIRGKQRDCEYVGFDLQWLKFNPETVKTVDIATAIYEWAWKYECGGIIIQLPLPDHIDIEKLQSIIPDRLDVDGFKLTSPHRPCTPKGIIDYLDYCKYSLEGKDALVIGRSDIVGKPLAQMLLEKNATVTVAHSKTANLAKHMKNSDIIFSSINQVEFFKPGDVPVRYGYCPDIIDITLGQGKDGKLHGSFSSKAVNRVKLDMKANIISGIGGVGLLTRLALMQNVCNAMEL